MLRFYLSAIDGSVCMHKLAVTRTSWCTRYYSELHDRVSAHVSLHAVSRCYETAFHTTLRLLQLSSITLLAPCHCWLKSRWIPLHAQLLSQCTPP